MNKEIKLQKEDIRNQHDEIKWHLQQNSSITSWEAIKNYGITRLAAIIFNLRKEGFTIVSNKEIVKKKFGREITVVTYIYSKPLKINKQTSIYDYI